jgi:hypothetical protein
VSVVFEISRVVHGVPFQIGFCTGWKIHAEKLIVDQPFTHMVLHVPYGALSCRGPWTNGRKLALEAHMISPFDLQPWMELDAADLIPAIDLCAALAVDLPADGFRRI